MHNLCLLNVPVHLHQERIPNKQNFFSCLRSTLLSRPCSVVRELIAFNLQSMEFQTQIKVAKIRDFGSVSLTAYLKKLESLSAKRLLLGVRLLLEKMIDYMLYDICTFYMHALVFDL